MGYLKCKTRSSKTVRKEYRRKSSALQTGRGFLDWINSIIHKRANWLTGLNYKKMKVEQPACLSACEGLNKSCYSVYWNSTQWQKGKNDWTITTWVHLCRIVPCIKASLKRLLPLWFCNSFDRTNSWEEISGFQKSRLGKWLETNNTWMLWR